MSQEDIEPSSQEQQAVTLNNKFRIRSKLILLTYPQCTMTKEQAMNNITSYNWGNNKPRFIVAEERHQDGTPHLHVLLSFAQKFSTKKVSMFDFIGNKHPNIQSQKSLQKSVEYVTKDGNYIADGIQVNNQKKSTTKLSSQVAELIQSGNTLEKVHEKDPGYYMMNKRKIDEYYEWVQRKKMKPELTWTEISTTQMLGLPDCLVKICKWLNKNLFKPRAFGQKECYIHGPTQMGKTTLILSLVKYCRIYQIPLSEDFYDFYEDEDYDLAVLDEFKAQKTIQWLNLWCQGGANNIRKKGRQYIKKKQIPTIILSNYSLEDCYRNSNEDKLETIRRRLKIIYVDVQIKLPFQ